MFTYLNKRRKKGQSTMEYAVLIIIIIGALMSIQVYLKRGVQGRLKGAADDIGDQFSPGNTNYFWVSNVTNSGTRDQFGAAAGGVGISNSVLQGNERTTSGWTQNVINAGYEYWGGR